MARARSTWTPEQARHFAALGRAEQARRRLQARQTSEQALTLATVPSWEQALLGRTRAQVSGLLDLLDLERLKTNPDGQRLNWLASALERLAELDRVLSGRPLPGSRRPLPERAADARPGPRPPIEPRAPTPPPVAQEDNGAQDEPPPAGLLTEPPEW